MTTATRYARPRPATTPVEGVVRSGVEIETAAGVVSKFTLVWLDPDPTAARWGVRLVKSDGELYDIHMDTAGVIHCDCPDGTAHPERPGGCKHVRALAATRRRFAALAGLGVAPTGTAPALPAPAATRPAGDPATAA